MVLVLAPQNQLVAAALAHRPGVDGQEPCVSCSVAPLNAKGDDLVIIAELGAHYLAALRSSQSTWTANEHLFSVEATVVKHLDGHDVSLSFQA